MDHCIDGRVLFPATGYLCLAWKMLARALNQNMEEMPVVFEDVTLHQATILPKTGEMGRAAGVRVGSRLLSPDAHLLPCRPQGPWP